MVIIRGSQRFLKTMGLRAVRETPASTNPLGDWYVTTVPLKRGVLVPFVNAPSRLVVLCEGAPLPELLNEFRERLRALLADLGLSRAAVSRELGEHDVAHFSKAVDRSVVGTLTDLCGVHIPGLSEIDRAGRMTNCAEMERSFARMPHLCLKGDHFPVDVVRRILEADLDAQPRPTRTTRFKDTKACEKCGRLVPAFQRVHFGSATDSRLLCMTCCNAAIARQNGVTFEDAEFHPQRLVDAGGVEHEFHFTTRYLGDSVALDAHEVREGTARGHEFQVIGPDPNGDLMDLFAELLAKMRRALAQRHLRRGEHRLEIRDPGVVRGRIDCDLVEESYRKPLLVIDGEEISWEAFGELLMSFEGFQFKFEVFDKSEER